MNESVAQVVVGLPVEGPFDYALESSLRGQVKVGGRVWVSFNRRPQVGFVVGLKQKSSFKNLNPVLSCLDSHPALDQKILRLTKEFSRYYGCSWGEAIETWLPAALRGKKYLELTPPKTDGSAGSHPPETILVHDKTTDKRWPLILDAVQKTRQAGGSIIFLVPEASLIAAVVEQLKGAFPDSVTTWDKKLNPSKDLSQWIEAREGRVSLVVGTRSAVFAPMENLGLIIIYEEENSAYKQEQNPHYHVHKAAQMRAKIDHCSLFYVSSAPLAETWYEAKKEKWQRITLEADHPAGIQIVDMTNYNPQRSSILSFPLQAAIQKTLENNGKVLLFMNRKGFSMRTRCHQCGFTLQCGRCNVNLTYLYSKKKMVCRHCHFTTELPRLCPSCQGSYLRSTGTGIEKLESEAARFYPQASVGRYDSDSAQFPEQADIVIATQAVLRRKGIFHADLAAVLHFDEELHHPDFRSAQTAFSLLVHLRQFAREKFLIQTSMTDNYCLQALTKEDFDSFYRSELKLRQEMGFPPYRHLVAIGLRGPQEDLVWEQTRDLFTHLNERCPKGVEISDPHPDPMPKLRDKYRFMVMLKGKSAGIVLRFARTALKDFKRKRNTVITVHVDP